MTDQIYPKKVKLADNEELKELIKEKSEIVITGRKKSEEIEELEKQMAETEKQLIEEEKKVDLKEFEKKRKSITKRMEKCTKDVEDLQKLIVEKIKAGTPQELRDKYDNLKKQKDDAETERNKIALDAQKRNDKIIPLAREIMKPYLENQYDDYESIQIENGELVATIFNHLQEFEERFNATKKV